MFAFVPLVASTSPSTSPIIDSLLIPPTTIASTLVALATFSSDSILAQSLKAQLIHNELVCQQFDLMNNPSTIMIEVLM